MHERPPFISFLAVICASGAFLMLLLAVPALVLPGEFKLNLSNRNELIDGFSFAIQMRRWSIAALAGYLAVAFGVAARGLWQMRKYGALWGSGIMLVMLVFSVMLLTPLTGSTVSIAFTVALWVFCAATISYLLRSWRRMA